MTENHNPNSIAVEDRHSVQYQIRADRQLSDEMAPIHIPVERDGVVP